MRCTVVLSLLSVTLPAGCVPYPHVERIRPEIDGFLTIDGIARTGVEVRSCLDADAYSYQAHPHACEHKATTTTDAQGRFHLEGYREFEMMLFLGDRISMVGLTVKDADREASWHRSGFGPSVDRATLSCALMADLACR